jgi:hypothetical protein
MIIYIKKSYKAHCVCHITSKAKSQKHQDDENYNWPGKEKGIHVREPKIRAKGEAKHL